MSDDRQKALDAFYNIIENCITAREQDLYNDEIETVLKSLTNQRAEQDKRPRCKHCGEIIEQHNTDGGWCCLFDPIDNNEEILWSDTTKFEPLPQLPEKTNDKE